MGGRRWLSVVALVATVCVPGPAGAAGLGDALTAVPRQGEPTRRHLPALSGVRGALLDARKAAPRVAAVKAPEVRLRGVTDIRLYEQYAPSVVMVVNRTRDGVELGTGSLISADGRVLTNWHVVGDAPTVGILFKPADDRDGLDMERMVKATVLARNPVVDLALVKLDSVPAGLVPIPLGSQERVQVGMDAHAIGHPQGEWWSYTKGVVSQIRVNYTFRYGDGIDHRADVLQTQTPISPGNSGGPLLDDEGYLIGVNSFAADGAQNLNYAIDITEVKRFLDDVQAGRFDRPATTAATPAAACRPTALSRDYDAATHVLRARIDTDCDGRQDALLTAPDDTASPVELALDSDGDGKIDVVVRDNDHDGRWDISYHDKDGDGKADLIGEHPDGALEPSRFRKA